MKPTQTIKKPFKVLIGMITFGGLPFTQLAIREINHTTKAPIDFFVVNGKPDDQATCEWLKEMEIPHLHHVKNWGMCKSVNDIYDRAFRPTGLGLSYAAPELAKTHRLGLGTPGSYDAVIFVGNDVVVYPGAIDAMIAEAERGVYDWVCASEYDVRCLCRDYPAARPWFEGDRLNFTDFTRRPWDLHAHRVPQAPPESAGPQLAGGGVAGVDAPQPPARGTVPPAAFGVQPDCRKDTYNLCLYTRRSFEMLGYMDVNFWPSGYFGDNDWGYRGDLAQVRACGLAHACYFHFWSRTLHQAGGAGCTGQNQQFYVEKWGGIPTKETFRTPWNRGGMPNITSRDGELGEITKWLR